ncbi:integrase zinc binding domain-containing protein, partial [Acinetobacter baumannii]|uniref:integrase zinc binding domain-containing protein n=1 Tax=Acinetobacter baumannii TaxID=470 RepID=UPI0011787CE4
LVVDNKAERERILHETHQASGHKGLAKSYDLLRRSFYWEGMYKHMTDLVKGCDVCQRYSKKGYVDEFGYRPVKGLMEECSMDHVYIGPGNSNKYLINL